jgi:hypothetical protein
MKTLPLAVAAMLAFCSPCIFADEKPMHLTTTGWGRSQQSFAEAPSYIRLHRWLLAEGFTPCKPIKWESIPNPPLNPNAEEFWYSGEYKGSPIHVYIEYGAEPNKLGLYAVINVPTQAEMEELKKKVEPFVEKAKSLVDPVAVPAR